MGLELKPSKTRIAHTFEKYGGQAGFDFLGFHARQYKVGKASYRTSGHSEILVDFKAFIKPSKEAIIRHYRAVAEVIDRNKSAEQANLIRLLNPVIRGWSNYYSTVVSKELFSKLDHLVTKKLLRWAKRRHQKQSRKRTAAKYWSFSENGRSWTSEHRTAANSCGMRTCESNATGKWRERKALSMVTGYTGVTAFDAIHL
jgi:RNA-directed DNA polymerase